MLSERQSLVSGVRGQAELAALSGWRLRAPEPVVTVVIPVFNKWAITAHCLESLLRCDPDVAVQVVVIDDGSSEDVAARLAELPGVDVVRNGWNIGFVHSSNRGAALARGRYILFLNNDTELTSGALRALVARLEADERIAIAGSKLVYPDGTLQEAGGIIWSDGTGWNYGRGDSPLKPQYNYARDVDYVSGASLMIRAETFRELGGFDLGFVPGYYEDADLCFAARARGKRVVYEPASVVVHAEGATSGTDTSAGMKRFQSINRRKFRLKWARTLAEEHIASDAANVARAARRRAQGKHSILIVDSYVPQHDHDAGSNRIKRLIDGFRAADLHVIFFPDNLIAAAPYTQELQQNGVEVIFRLPEQTTSWREQFTEALPNADIVWLSRPDLCRKYLPIVRAHSELPVLYDTIDLHHLRLRRQAEHDASIDARTWQHIERLELSCAKAADATIVVSDYEAAILRERNIERIAIVPTIHDVEPARRRAYAQTAGILFIGGYAHPPNIDAAQWLVREIVPLVRKALPDVVVTLLGSNPPASVRALASESVIVPGFIPDVSDYFAAARVFVAPLRFGAGLKGKVGQALGYGLPLVTTTVAAEGFHLTNERHALIADDTTSFADSIIRIYGDAELWAKLRDASAEALGPFNAKNVVANAIAEIERIIDASPVRAGGLVQS